MKGLLFTYALTYGGSAVALFNPWIGLLIYICFAIIRPDSLWYWSVPVGNYSRIIAIALLFGWAGRGFGNWRLGRAATPVYALVGFLTWAALGAVIAPNQEQAWAFIDSMLKIVVPVVVGITLIDSVEELKQLAWVIMLSQGFVAYEMNLSYYQGFNRMQEGFGGMDNNCNAIAMTTVVGLAFFLGLSERIAWRKWLAFAIAGLMAHSIMFSFSRGGMLGLVVVGATCFILIPKQPKSYAYLLLAVVLALRLAGPQVVARFTSAFAEPEERDASAQSRLDLWADCVSVIVSKPLTGLGPNHWRLMASHYGWTEGKSAHTLWLETGAELGVPGLLLLIIFYASTAFRLWPMRRIRDSVDPAYADIANMVIASLVGFAVTSQFVSLLGLEVPYYVTLLGAGALKLVPSGQYTLSSDSIAVSHPAVHRLAQATT